MLGTEALSRVTGTPRTTEAATIAPLAASGLSDKVADRRPYPAVPTSPNSDFAMTPPDRSCFETISGGRPGTEYCLTKQHAILNFGRRCNDRGRELRRPYSIRKKSCSAFHVAIATLFLARSKPD